MRTAPHFANRDLVLEVVATFPPSGYLGEGTPAVLREPDSDDSWFSAELFDENGQEVAFYVNAYGDEFTARTDARRRSKR